MRKLTEQEEYRKIVSDYRTSQSAMAQYHADWREFDAYYLAEQWSAQRASWRPDPVVNYISYVVDQKKPQLTNNRPTGIILPVAAGDEEAAHLFTQVTDVVADRVDLDSVVDEVVQTGLLLDVAWFYVYWDNSLSGGSLERKNIWKGDVVVESVDPANIYYDPQAVDIEDARYVIYAVPKTTQWVKEKFGKDVKPDGQQSFETEIYDRPGTEQAKDRVMFYAYWTRKNGKLNVTYAAGEKILKKVEGVYKHGRYPFIPFVSKKRRKSIIGIGEPRNIINNQKLLNKLIEMPTTSALLTANPIALINRKSGINKNHWVSKPGMVWEVADDPGKAVYWLQPPQFQGDVYKLTDMLTSYIEKIGGIYDALTGETPKGVTAASAIQLLQEQGSIPIKGIARNLYSSLKEVYKQIIELVKEFYTETRYIRITGEEGGTEFVQFQAAQYADVDFDVKVSAGPSTPMSRAYITQLADDLFNKQLLLGSEYVDMQEGLPNKDRIVARLREMESQPPPPEQPQQNALPGAAPQQMPTVDDIYAQAPPQLQQEIDLMREQGIQDDQILQTLMQLLNQ
ncbi:portal protein [Paenibacillus sp. IITD108]|uniref:portal protein n=1 Tax=Paenibacillus sp. IITD108 TaxID=3116649 RepID=UPI002F3F8267